MASLLPNGKQIFVDANGTPLAGGFVFFYVPGTTTLKTTWADPNQTTANTNPVVLDGAGGAVIYGSGQYRQVLQDLNGNQIWDDLTADPLTNVGPVTFNGPATFNGGLTVANGTFTADGAAILNGGISVSGNFHFSSAGTIDGGLTVSNSLTIATGSLNIPAGGGYIQGGLTVDNSIHMASGTFTADGPALLNQGATINGSLGIPAGGGYIQGGLTVDNSIHMASGIFTADGPALLNQGATINGSLGIPAGGGYIQGGLTVDNSIHMASGIFTADGPALLNQGATINGAFVSNTGATLWGTTVQNGDLFVHSGTILSDGRGIPIGAYYYLSGTGTGGPVGAGTFTYGFTTNNRMSAAEFDAFSDSRAKDNKQPISREDGLRFARIVTPITFEWNGLAAAAPSNPGEVQAGYSAQQIISAGFGHMTSASPNAKMPETVETFDGVEVRSVAGVEMHVNYSEATPYLHVALSAALDMIAALEARLAAAGL